ncbi:unnamed protein product [Arabidopsis thaliana]|uniref:Uncharacterized protein n=1 Tax=Arabidopsis thaliana TaxID=3702 RepID=Q9LJA5_ARATH|nr:unnamed protein product [Arabidopsis thaliana]
MIHKHIINKININKIISFFCGQVWQDGFGRTLLSNNEKKKSRRRRKYVLSALGGRCKDLKQHIWMKYRRNTIEKAFEARRGLIPEDQWREFVEIQFTDKAKKVRERNINSRNNHKIPHTLERKSLARKPNEMEEETSKEPNRAELFIVSRTKSDESLLCNEARFTLDKLSQVMTQNIQDEASETSTESRPYDAFEQVFGYEPSGRVRCMGRGVTPSKYLLNHESMTSNTEILEMKTRLKGLEEKLDIVTDALLVLVKSKSQFQVTASATTGNKKVKTDLHQSSSINSDQVTKVYVHVTVLAYEIVAMAIEFMVLLFS